MERDTPHGDHVPNLEQIIDEAARWAVAIEEADDSERTEFVQWLRTSPRHIEEFLAISSIEEVLAEYDGGRQFLSASARESHDSQHSQAAFVTLLAALARKGHREHAMYVRYRLPVLRVLLHRGIEPDTARGLLQQTFVRVLKALRSNRSLDETQVSTCLYQICCDLAKAYERDEFLTRRIHFPNDLMGLTDEALSLEERLDHELLSKSVKTLLRRLSDGSDKEVLTRFYLREEPRDKICSALALTSYQFNESLVRARRRFAEILRREGVALADVDVSCRRSTQKAARYVADELGLLKKAEFEIHMIQNNCCNREVDVWSTIKRYMPGSRGRKRVIG